MVTARPNMAPDTLTMWPRLDNWIEQKRRGEVISCSTQEEEEEGLPHHGEVSQLVVGLLLALDVLPVRSHVLELAEHKLSWNPNAV